MDDVDALQDPRKPLVLAGKITLLLAVLSVSRVAVEIVQTRDLGTPAAYLIYLGLEVFLYGAAFVTGLGLKARRSWATTAAAIVAAAMVVDSTASLIVNGSNVLKLVLLSGSGNLPHRTAFASRGVMTALHLAYWPWVLSLLHRTADRRRLWRAALLSAGLCAAIQIALFAAFGC